VHSLDLFDRLSRILGRVVIRDATVDSQLAAVSAAGAVKVDGSAATQPISGTVTANQGTPAAFANRWPVASLPFFRDTNAVAFPAWVIAAPVTAPAAGAALVTKAAGGVGVVHRCFGWFAGNELGAANLIQIRDGATVKTGMSIGTGTPLYVLSPVPIVIGTANTAMSVNVLNAGAAGEDYVAGILIESV